MKYMGSATSDMGQSQHGLKADKIDWDDYNYPPCIKVWHYTGSEVPQQHSTKVLLLKVNHIWIIIANLLNFITNIVAAAQGAQGSAIRIGISVFVFLLWVPISFYMFIIPMEVLLKNEGKIFIFYAFSFFAMLWYIIWSIADFADANGFVKVAFYFDEGMGGAGFFAVVTAVLMLLIAALALVNLVIFYRR